MAKAKKVVVGRGKTEERGSSHDKGEAQASEGVPGDNPAGGKAAEDEPAGDDLSGVEALYTAVTEAQDGEKVAEAEEPMEDWLAAGPQAPEPVLDPCPRKRAANQGAVVSDPTPATKKAKEAVSKSSIPEVARGHSPRLSGAKAPSVEKPAAMEDVPGVRSSSSSSQSSSSSEHLTSRQESKLPASSVPPP
nr:sperm acrosomal protein FSA-ACR.1-like [Aegilops tauschii subsp. strangulata]